MFGASVVPISAQAAPTAQAAQAALTAEVIQDLGTPLTSLTVMEGAFGREADGRAVVYAVPAGENAQLNIVDLNTRERLRTIPLAGAAGAWAITIATDGSVYIGTYPNAHLYRYRPETQTVTDLGAPVGGESFMFGLTAGKDGSVYAGTYPNAHAFKYDPVTNEFTDYGSMDPVQQYVRAAAYDPDRNALFLGLATPVGKLIRIDLETGAREDLTPPDLHAKDIQELDYANGRVFANAAGRLVVFDAATGKQVTFTDRTTGTPITEYPIGARGVSPAGPGGVYFTSNLNLTRYDLENDTVGPVASGVRVTRGGAMGYGWIVEAGQPMLYGLGGNYSGGTWRYHPTTGVLQQWSSPFLYVPSPLMHTIADPATGNILLNAFLNGTTATYDPVTTRTIVTARQGQVEGWAWKAANQLYVGVYPYGRLQLWDPHAPATPTNPRILFDLVDSHLQNRPVSVVPSGDRVYVGTTPGYGEYGGAFTVYTISTDKFVVHRNLVADQTIASIQPVGSAVWAGSSIEGGQGTEPRAPEAHLVKVDPATGTVLKDLVPVPGAESITELSIGPDGKLWGLADGTVFVADPTTGEVSRRIAVFDSATGSADGAMSWRDGYLYAVNDGRLFVVDSLAGTKTILRDRGLLRLTQAPTGIYYMLLRPDGDTSHTHLASYTPPVDPCPTSDLRATVWTGNIDSKVANRHLRYGCTLIDDLPDAEATWPSHKAYVTAVGAKVTQLVQAGLITHSEGYTILLSANRSNVGR
ncbi:Vgb family protein [Kribbella sp. CA-294648]|uniref:Vgb family protein n=1 Tax=Kribbella sp. CA-294648 TaxID=3239948 RepID=UPI003D8BFD79